jgi:hypothetical protein
MNKPNAVSELQTIGLEKVLDEFPYFQSARALRLKGLYNQNSFKYNFALKVTAAHTTDRSILFDFITSDLMPLKKTFLKKKQELLNITVLIVTKSVFKKEIESTTTSLERSILSSIKEATPIKEKSKKTRLKKN